NRLRSTRTCPRFQKRRHVAAVQTDAQGNPNAPSSETARLCLGAGARIFGMRHGGEFTEMPVSRRRGGLSATPKRNWIDSSIRMQTGPLRFATRQLPQRVRAPSAGSDLRTPPISRSAPAHALPKPAKWQFAFS